MTREEAIKILAKMRERYRICEMFKAEALNMAIQALEQPTVDVLEQIRDEIEAIDITMGIKDYPFIPKAKVLEIIDKYRESEE